MEFKYKEGDVVLVKARIIRTNPDDKVFFYKVILTDPDEWQWVRADEVYDFPTPEPTPAASSTRPDVEPPMYYMDTPYQVGHMQWIFPHDLSLLNFWDIEWKLVTLSKNDDLLIQVTAVSQMYLDAVAKKKAAAAEYILSKQNTD